MAALQGVRKMAAQIVAVIIFLAMFAFIVWDKIERHIVTLTCGALTLVLVFGLCMHDLNAVLETLNVRVIFTLDFWYHLGATDGNSAGINWETIIFIAGMMIMVEGMARVGFFRWLCMAIAKLVRYQPVPILIAFMIVSGVLSMFIDSITVILFLAAITIELARVVHFNPAPVILAEIFCANLGGSATMCGDPPNIIIGTSLGYTFMDFLSNTGVVAGISMVVMVVFFYFCFHRELTAGLEEGQHRGGTLITERVAENNPEEAAVTVSRAQFLGSAGIFFIAVVLLITHAQTGLTVAFIGMFVAALMLLTAGKDALKLIKGVDYKTLLFFIGLFIVVGGLEQTGILRYIAGAIGEISHGKPLLMIVIIIWVSGFASAFIDNIPFAATMIPVIRTLAQTQGIDLHILAWALALGTDIGGSATPIGASANVVGLSVAAKNGHKVGWGKYCKYMAPASILVLLISTVYIWMRYL